MALVLHPPKNCPDLSSLWFRYFQETLDNLSRYHADDTLTPTQAAHALRTRPSTLYQLAKFDRHAPHKPPTGPITIETKGPDATFRPARMYRVSDLIDWIKRLADTRRTIYGEAIIGKNEPRKGWRMAHLSRMVNLSARDATRAEKIAGRFLLRIGADVADKVGDQIAERVARILAEKALEEATAPTDGLEIDNAPLDNGYYRAVDTIPEPHWPMSDPRVTGRSISREQFRLALRALGMTPMQFADFWGVRPSTAYSWHNGALPVPMAVADYLRMKVGAFVRLRCAELGLPVPVTAMESDVLPSSKPALDAVDTLRAMVEERNPTGAGHDEQTRSKRGRPGRKKRRALSDDDFPDVPLRAE